MNILGDDVIAVEEMKYKFNINTILKKVFFKVKSHTKSNGCEVIYIMGKTVPRLFRGNEVALEVYLTEVFVFLFEYARTSEMLVRLEGEEEFVGTEDITFKIKNIELTTLDIKKLSRIVAKEGEVLGAKIDYSSTELRIKIPFTLSVLGMRRHYRLPSKSLLQKNVLIIAESKNITLSIKQMFKYFPYNVDMGIRQKDFFNYDIDIYDLLVIEDKLMNELINTRCKAVQDYSNLKIVVLGDIKNMHIREVANISSSLLKPVTQESIFELIVSVFADEYNSEAFLNQRKKLKQVEEISSLESRKRRPASQKVLKKVSNVDSFQVIVEEKRDKNVPILDITLGKKNAKYLRLDYEDELESFFDTFNGSDLYFRQMINEKSYKPIQEFCTDLEKHSKIIGAQSMVQFAEMISMIFVYNKYELLEIYPGRYHIELKKLFKEMERYFS